MAVTVDDVAQWARRAADHGEDVAAALRLAADVGVRLPPPGRGDTGLRWSVLAAVAGADLTAARVLEAHSDALAIFDEAGEGEPAPGGQTWGVFAAEAPPARLDAAPDGPRWRLSGTKPWCSLGGVLDAALVTAHVDGGRRLFAVDLQTDTVCADPPQAWASRGLRNVTSTAVHFDGAPARPVGATDWYLSRSGFAWGGMGVAACWFGAAQALGATVSAASARRGGDLMAMHVGAVDVALHSADAVLAAAAVQVDAGGADGPAGALLALRVRSVVAAAAETVLEHCAHALGPAPLAFDEVHARRVADLQIYVRQHHAERDLAALGKLVT